MLLKKQLGNEIGNNRSRLETRELNTEIQSLREQINQLQHSVPSLQALSALERKFSFEADRDYVDRLFDTLVRPQTGQFQGFPQWDRPSSQSHRSSRPSSRQLLSRGRATLLQKPTSPVQHQLDGKSMGFGLQCEPPSIPEPTGKSLKVELRSITPSKTRGRSRGE